MKRSLAAEDEEKTLFWAVFQGSNSYMNMSVLHTDFRTHCPTSTKFDRGLYVSDKKVLQQMPRGITQPHAAPKATYFMCSSQESGLSTDFPSSLEEQQAWENIGRSVFTCTALVRPPVHRQEERGTICDSVRKPSFISFITQKLLTCRKKSTKEK